MNRVLFTLLLNATLIYSPLCSKECHLPLNSAPQYNPKNWWWWDEDEAQGGADSRPHYDGLSFVLDDLVNLEDRLNTEVIGQEYAVKATVRPLLRHAAGLSNPERPVGVLLYAGPTGVGKTQLAKSLSKELLGSEQDLIRLDMAEYSEEWRVSQLIGSAPGYVNHEAGGQLTNALQGRKDCIILLDEIEKAHPKIRKLFLAAFDEARITDAKGYTYDLSSSLFILTTNIAGERILDLSNEGWECDEILRHVQGPLIGQLSPELYNRVQPAIFKGLSQEALDRLVTKELEKVAQRIYAAKAITLHYHPSVQLFFADQLIDNQLGARPLQRLIDNYLVSSLAYLIITEDIPDGTDISISVQGDELIFFFNV